MASDKLVFDLSSEIEGSTNVFIKKDWVNILDNMNTNYSSNQSVIDTSQLSNSNKYMSYREAYLLVPMLLTITNAAAGAADNGGFLPATAGTSCDYSIGLKSWFGQIIHSFTLDYNGVTVIQQTPYINMINSFKLLTSLSWGDVLTQGATIGFFPDTSTSYQVNNAAAAIEGQGVCNNIINPYGMTGSPTIGVAFNTYLATGGNLGALKRCQYINYDSLGQSGTETYATLQNDQAAKNMWKSFISTKVNGVNGGVSGVFQITVTATIYLKHIHSFFAMCPLLKGVFMKMTMNLNNTSATFTTVTAAPNTTMTLTSVGNAVGGVCPFLLSAQSYTVATVANPPVATNTVLANLGPGSYIASVAVGSRVLNPTQAGIPGVQQGQCSQSVYLYVPAYTFNPVFESAYLSSPIKRIAYEDVYQYQVLNVGAGASFNNLLTNGIANLKSVLIVPFFSVASNGLPIAIPTFQSPFDTAGSGTTSPLIQFNNFNVVVSGQNAIYNTQQRMFEQFNDQLAGCNAVNGGLTDGLTSSLIGALDFDHSYCYYYVNVERMLPVEQSVPKSVQIIGINQSARSVDLYCFLSYQSIIEIDLFSGSRV